MQPARFARLLIFAVLGGCAATAPTGRPPSATPGAGAAGVDSWAPPPLPAPAPIAAAEYAARRGALVGSMRDGVLLVLGAEAPAADYLTFNQTNDIRYLTGITEPDAALVMTRRGSAVTTRLFVAPRDPSREVWEGARLGIAGAHARTGIATYPIAQLLPALDSLLAAEGTFYTNASFAPDEGNPLRTRTAEEQVVRALLSRHPNLQPASIVSDLQRLRATKSAAEIDRIRRAVYITSLAQRAAMRTIEPGMNEFEIQGLIEYTFRRNGAERPSFASIVGSGPRSTALHYSADDRFMQEGEVVVMDIGASYDGYAADVTRTVPTSGRFSADQRAVYEIVLAAQKAAEALARPGADWRQLNAAADSVIASGLTRLGLIESPTATYRCAARPGMGDCPQLRLFYMHGLGHGIGLEVHDPEASYYGPFAEGSVFTIEPGIYIRSEALEHLPDTPENRALVSRIRPVVERFRNIGVRIEDDFLITPTGTERLSAGAPREIEEIEALMRLPGVSTPERRPHVVEWYRGLGQAE
jgi:Xaa-Pro aminopeptidase